MVATIAVITAITVKKKKKGSEIAARITATMIAEIEKVPSQRFFLSAIAAIVAIIWKPGFTVTNR